jgi:hypothetical protein
MICYLFLIRQQDNSILPIYPRTPHVLGAECWILPKK